MKRKLLVIAAAAVLGSGAIALAEEEASADGLDRTGEVVDCLNLRQVENIHAVDDSTLVVRVGVSDYYVTETNGQCTGASHPNTRIERIRTGNRLCQNDIVKVVDNSSGIMRGSCSLGSFERLSKAPE